MAEYTPPNTINPIFNPEIYNIQDLIGTTINSGDVTEIEDTIALFENAITPAYAINKVPTSSSGLPYNKLQQTAVYFRSTLAAGSYIFTIIGNGTAYPQNPNWTRATLGISWSLTNVINLTQQQVVTIFPTTIPSGSTLPLNATFFIESTSAGTLYNVCIFLICDQDLNFTQRCLTVNQIRVKSYLPTYVPIIPA